MAAAIQGLPPLPKGLSGLLNFNSSKDVASGSSNSRSNNNTSEDQNNIVRRSSTEQQTANVSNSIASSSSGYCSSNSGTTTGSQVHTQTQFTVAYVHPPTRGAFFLPKVLSPDVVVRSTQSNPYSSKSDTASSGGGISTSGASGRGSPPPTSSSTPVSSSAAAATSNTLDNHSHQINNHTSGGVAFHFPSSHVKRSSLSRYHIMISMYCIGILHFFSPPTLIGLPLPLRPLQAHLRGPSLPSTRGSWTRPSPRLSCSLEAD